MKDMVGWLIYLALRRRVTFPVVSKSIDNDRPMLQSLETFGSETLKEHGAWNPKRYCVLPRLTTGDPSARRCIVIVEICRDV